MEDTMKLTFSHLYFIFSVIVALLVGTALGHFVIQLLSYPPLKDDSNIIPQFLILGTLVCIVIIDKTHITISIYILDYLKQVRPYSSQKKLPSQEMTFQEKNIFLSLYNLIWLGSAFSTIYLFPFLPENIGTLNRYIMTLVITITVRSLLELLNIHFWIHRTKTRL
jgi:hypothetical protein